MNVSKYPGAPEGYRSTYKWDFRHWRLGRIPSSCRADVRCGQGENGKIVLPPAAYTRLLEVEPGWHWKRRNAAQFGVDQLNAPCFYFILHISQRVAPMLICTDRLTS